MTPKFYLFHFVLRYKIFVAVVVVILVLFYTQINRFYLLNQNYVQEPIDVVYTWVNGSDPRFLADLQTFLSSQNAETVDSSPQRFDDKYELKFSLRSLEKYAPWIRHVYIVTNGQIPYWLNLDYEKVTVVSHEDIFPDPSDLPTFSSPAIESHLHRIPGISKRFIYLNDDIFFGAPVHREDFHTENRGYLVYVTWPIPPCADDCPWMYVNDGQCDSQCYNKACQMDGNDCDDEEKDESGMIVEHRNVETEQIYQSNTSSQSLIFKSNASDLTRAISEHNSKILLNDKLRRRKRKYGSVRSVEAKKSVDAFGESLQSTNRMLNAKYGFKTRYVAAHAPILIDIEVMSAMQRQFRNEFKATSRKKLRSGDDVQFSFAYYYFLMQERVHVDAGRIFDYFDTDASGTWSDREIRTILTKLYELPLSYAVVDHFEYLLTNCSTFGKYAQVPTPEFERYIDSKLPTISRDLVVHCPILAKILKIRFGSRPAYKFHVISNAHSGDVTFKMLNSNISEVVGHLDEIRRKTSKFVCLNDNLEEGKGEDNDLVKSVLYDFYLSLFPLPSKFELPHEFRNRFLHLDELNDWKTYHLQLKIIFFLVFLAFLYICTFRLFAKRTIFNKNF